MLSMGEESGGRPPLPRVFFRDEETARNAFKQAHAANGHGVPGAQPWQAPGPSTPGLGFHLPLLPHGASDRAGNPSESHNGTFYGAPPPGASTWPPSTAAAPAFGHGSPRNPRKRAWDEDTETEKADQLNGSVSSEDAMMTDDMSPQLQALPSLDSLPSGTNHGRQEDHETGLFMHGAHTAHGVGEGGMLGRFKRVRMNDGPDDGRDASYTFPPVDSYRDPALASKFSSPPPPHYVDHGPHSPPNGALSSSSAYDAHYLSPQAPMSPPLPGRFRINLRTPSATPGRGGGEGPKTPPASPYAGVNLMLGQLHIRHREEGHTGSEGVPTSVHESQNSIAMQYAHVNHLLRQLEDSRRERREDRGEWRDD